MYKEKIVDTITGEEIWRDYTDDQIEEVKRAEEKIAQLAIKQSEAEAKRQALLDKLGITTDEAKLLLA
jgi:hypothetical protein